MASNSLDRRLLRIVRWPVAQTGSASLPLAHANTPFSDFVVHLWCTLLALRGIPMSFAISRRWQKCEVRNVCIRLSNFAWRICVSLFSLLRVLLRFFYRPMPYLEFNVQVFGFEVLQRAVRHIFGCLQICNLILEMGENTILIAYIYQFSCVKCHNFHSMVNFSLRLNYYKKNSIFTHFIGNNNINLGHCVQYFWWLVYLINKFHLFCIRREVGRLSHQNRLRSLSSLTFRFVRLAAARWMLDRNWHTVKAPESTKSEIVSYFVYTRFARIQIQIVQQNNVFQQFDSRRLRWNVSSVFVGHGGTAAYFRSKRWKHNRWYFNESNIDFGAYVASRILHVCERFK